jgi:hypothetical protein
VEGEALVGSDGGEELEELRDGRNGAPSGGPGAAEGPRQVISGLRVEDDDPLALTPIPANALKCYL